MGKVSKLRVLFLWLPVLGYVTTGIIILPLQLATYILIKPWSLRIYRKISYYFSLIMCWHPTFLVSWWSGSNIQSFANPTDLPNLMGNEHALILFNHKYETELLVLMTILNYFGRIGNARSFTKKSTQYVPIPGWLWKLHEHIFLERNFENDKKIIGKAVQSLMKHSDSVLIAMCPEGTRFTKEKHTSSMAVAKKKGLSTLKHHLLPRTRGFVTCIEAIKNGDKFGLPVVVYDLQLVIESQDKEKRSCSVFDLLCGHGQNVKFLLRRYPIEDIPDDEIECANWLQNLYREKDSLMENCLKTGTFVGEKDDTVGKLSLQDYEFITIPKPCDVFMIIGGWNMICSIGIVWEVMHIFMSGDTFQLIAFGAIAIMLTVVFWILSYSTKSQKGSTYGIVSKK